MTGTGPSLVRAVGSNSGVAINRQNHLDALGSVMATTTGSQSVETDYVYDAWGNVLSGGATDNPFSRRRTKFPYVNRHWSVSDEARIRFRAMLRDDPDTSSGSSSRATGGELSP